MQILITISIDVIVMPEQLGIVIIVYLFTNFILQIHFSHGRLKHKFTVKEKTDEGCFVPVPTEVPQDKVCEFVLCQ